MRLNRFTKYAIKFRKPLSIALVFLIPLLLLISAVHEKWDVRNRNQISGNESRSNEEVLSANDSRERQLFPARLIIPIIDVNAAVQYLGVNQNGEMEVPSNSDDVGWFNGGPVPGEKGSAVISGHFDRTDGQDGVFAHLSKLKNGDSVYIQNAEKMITAFVVRDTQLYDPGYADEVFMRNDGTYLNLITCDGVWNEDKKAYTKRLVVFAEIIEKK